MLVSRRKSAERHLDREVEREGARSTQRALVEAVLQGNRAAGAELFARHAPDVRRFLQYAVGTHRELDDMLQEVFVNVFRDLRTLRNPDALAPFITSIAANVMRNHMRREKMRRLVGLTTSGQLPDREASTGSPLVAVARARLRAVVSRLSATDQTIFILRHHEEMSLGEVAQALDLSLATVKRRLARIITRLARRVRGDYILAGFLELAEEEEEEKEKAP